MLSFMFYKIIFYKNFAPSLNQFVQVSHLDKIFAEQKPRLNFLFVFVPPPTKNKMIQNPFSNQS